MDTTRPPWITIAEPQQDHFHVSGYDRYGGFIAKSVPGLRRFRDHLDDLITTLENPTPTQERSSPMFNPDTLREAFCIIAMESLHREGIHLNAISVYDRICHLSMLPAKFTAEFMGLRKIALDDADITKPQKIAPTVRRLLTELLKDGTPIV